MAKARTTIERAHLLAALKQAAQVVEARNTIPILSHLLLEAGSDGLRISASNLDQTVTVLVAAGVEGVARLCVPAAALTAFAASSLAGAEIEITLDPTRQRATARHGASRWQAPGLPAEDFPLPTNMPKAARSLAPPPLLAGAITRASYAVSREATRYYLNGVNLHHVPGTGDRGATLDVVATDGHRLVRVRLPLDEVQDKTLAGLNAIVPRQTLGALATLLSKGDANMEIDEARLRVTAGETTYITKLIDGTFPEYTRVIPSSNNSDTRVELRVDQLRHVLAAAESTREGKEHMLHIELSSDSVEVSGGEGDAAFSGRVEARVSLGASGDSGVGFNSRYLLQALDAMNAAEGEAGTVILLGANAINPWLLVDPAAINVTTVLMPARTNGGRQIKEEDAA